MALSAKRRQDVLDALRRGTVPQQNLDVFAVGLERFEGALDEALTSVRDGGAGMAKAVRGEYGSGKTFFARWLQERARQMGFATAEVQISETETPLHRLETVYRRMIENLATASERRGALRAVVDGWFFALEEDVLAEGRIDESDAAALLAATHELMEKRLSAISQQAPAFASALRGYREASARGDAATAEGLLGWLGGQPNVAASVKRAANIKGEVDHFGALSFLQGLLVVLRDAGHAGLLLVLDEVETLQRVRSDVREKGLNALRQLLDEIDGGRFPGLAVVITGTTAFYEGPQGIQRLPPLAQRLHVDFSMSAKFDNPRAPQIRLPGFDLERLSEVGRKVRDLYAHGAAEGDRVAAKIDDPYIEDFARSVAGELGGRIGVAPRIFLKKLVDVLDRVDQFEDFDPRKDYEVEVQAGELTAAERGAVDVGDPDEVDLPDD